MNCRSLVSSVSIFVLLTGCQTTQVAIEPMPAVVEGVFGACGTGSGSSDLRIIRDDSLIVSLALDWRSEGGFWQAEASSEIGETLLASTYDDKGLRFSGRMASFANHISVDEDGFLKVQGHRVGIKASEAPCLLSYRVPSEARNSVTSFQRNRNVAIIVAADPIRSWRITLSDVSRPPLTRVCIDLRWPGFMWPFSRRAEVCYRHDRGTTKGVDRGSIVFGEHVWEWSSIHGR